MVASYGPDAQPILGEALFQGRPVEIRDELSSQEKINIPNLSESAAPNELGERFGGSIALEPAEIQSPAAALYQPDLLLNGGGSAVTGGESGPQPDKQIETGNSAEIRDDNAFGRCFNVVKKCVWYTVGAPAYYCVGLPARWVNEHRLRIGTGIVALGMTATWAREFTISPEDRGVDNYMRSRALEGLAEGGIPYLMRDIGEGVSGTITPAINSVCKWGCGIINGSLLRWTPFKMEPFEFTPYRKPVTLGEIKHRNFMRDARSLYLDWELAGGDDVIVEAAFKFVLAERYNNGTPSDEHLGKSIYQAASPLMFKRLEDLLAAGPGELSSYQERLILNPDAFKFYLEGVVFDERKNPVDHGTNCVFRQAVGFLHVSGHLGGTDLVPGSPQGERLNQLFEKALLQEKSVLLAVFRKEGDKHICKIVEALNPKFITSFASPEVDTIIYYVDRDLRGLKGQSTHFDDHLLPVSQPIPVDEMSL